jgi:small-conductance mechanosensitive channel
MGSIDIISIGLENAMAVLPAIIGALIVLLIGWIAGRLLGKAARIVLDKITATATEAPMIGDSDLGKTLEKSTVSIGYLGDITVRCIVYLIAILAAVDILQLDYLSKLMTMVIQYIPHVVAFIIILIVGIILVDYFIDLFISYSKNKNIDLLNPVLVLVRLFLYFVTVMLALSQLELDLTIIYTLITPLAWGVGIGLGASIAIVVWFGMKNRSEQIMDKVMEEISK